MGFLSAGVLAESTISIATLDNEITLLEEATFSITITNDASVSQVYTVYGLEVAWGMDPEDRKFALGPGETKTTGIKVKPLGPFQPSSYSLKLYIDVSRSNEEVPTNRYLRELPVILYPEGPVHYLPTLRVTVEMDETIDPREPVPIRILLENRNPLDLTGLLIKMQSDIPELSKEILVDLPPLEKKALDFTVTLSPQQQPREYTLFFVLEKDGQTVRVEEKRIEIIPLTPPFTVEKEEKVVMGKKYIHLKITNPGNLLNTQEVRVPISFGEWLFSSGGGQSQRIQRQRYFAWEMSLGPGESSSLDYTVNYRVAGYILLVILLLVAFYYYVRSPVVFQKKATTVRGGEEGTLSEIKVTLNVENLTNKPLREVTITDLVPGIANVEKNLEIGTIKPHEIKHGKDGSKVVWSIAELDAHEHRVITYNIRAKLNILGTLSLSRATVEYKKGKNKRGKAYSNIFSINP